MYLNPQTIVLEVSEAVSLSLKDFHFGVEAFGDSVVAGEAPHAGNFLSPGVQRLAKLIIFTKPPKLVWENEIRAVVLSYDPVGGQARNYRETNFPNREPQDDLNPIHKWVHEEKRRIIVLKDLIIGISVSPWAPDERFNEVEQSWAKIRSYHLPVACDLKSLATPTVADLKQQGWGFTDFQNIFSRTKQSPIRPSPPRAHPCFLVPSRDNQIEEKVRAAGPPARFRLRISGVAPPTPLFATNQFEKPETRFRKTLMDSQKQLDLGTWVGLQKAFANVASGCSAVRAQCLKQVRDSHLVDDLGFTWEEFCTEQAGISRRHADHLIQQYERFGDAYFRLTEIAPVSPETFQQIAVQVTPDTIEINGQPLALTPENAPKIRAAIQWLRHQVQHPSGGETERDSRPPATVFELQVRLDAVLNHAAKTFHAINPIVPSDLDVATLRSLAAYGIDKFRALSRDLRRP